MTRNEQVEIDLRKKLKLEKTFKPEVINVFVSILNSFKVNIAIAGKIPKAGNEKDRWSALLKKHYERVQRQFRISPSIETKAKDDEDLTEEILAGLALWVEKNSDEVSDILVETTEQNMNDAINEARQALIRGGNVINNRALALIATQILRRKFRARVESIVTTETQFAAENTKNETADVINTEIIARGDVRKIVIKTWHTVGDLRVRPTHVIANDQKREIKRPFNVGGQRLMFPGDRSLGATAEEIVNCRCVSVLTISGNMINFHK